LLIALRTVRRTVLARLVTVLARLLTARRALVTLLPRAVSTFFKPLSRSLTCSLRRAFSLINAWARLVNASAGFDEARRVREPTGRPRLAPVLVAVFRPRGVRAWAAVVRFRAVVPLRVVVRLRAVVVRLRAEVLRLRAVVARLRVVVEPAALLRAVDLRVVRVLRLRAGLLGAGALADSAMHSILH
jgi:hypothetical protein